MQSFWIMHWYASKLRKKVVCQLGLYSFSRCTVLEAQDSVKHRMKFFRPPKRSGTSALITVQGFDDSQYMNCREIETPLCLWFRGEASRGGGLPIHTILLPASSTCKEEEEQVKWDGEKGRWPGEPSLVICKGRQVPYEALRRKSQLDLPCCHHLLGGSPCTTCSSKFRTQTCSSTLQPRIVSQ